MVTWKLISDAQGLAEWNDNLRAFDDYSIYQTIEWGNHRGSFGWLPYRWAAFEGERIVAMAQGLLRRYPAGVGLIWMPGGPVGDIATWGPDLQQEILRSTGLRWLYCRFNSFRIAHDDHTRLLTQLGWRKPRVMLTSGHSMYCDVSLPEEARLSACHRNWRHNLKRSGKYRLTVERWNAPDASALRSIYSEMEDYKQLAQQHSEPALKSLFTNLGDRLLVYRCSDSAGKLLAVRACAVLGEKAWDLLAAAAVAGRKTYASYATFWGLLQDCHRRGVRHYDLSGVDPAGNPGVYNFKQGTGAAPVDFLGEWEWAYPGLLALPVNWLFRSRRNGM